MKPPHVSPRHPHPKAAWASRHPTERRHVGRSVALSVGIHLLFAGLLCLLGLLTFADLLSKSSSISSSGPAAEQAMTVKLVVTETPPPPPTPTPKPAPETGLPALAPVPPVPKPPVVTIVPSPPKPAPQPVPVPAPPVVTAKVTNPTPSPAKPTPLASNKPKPKYTAAHATGQGLNTVISSAQLATLGLPAPTYPIEARSLHESGTVWMQVAFGPLGQVTDAQVHQSSGYSILDNSTRNYILVHWKSPTRANTSITVPIIYQFQSHVAGNTP